MKTTEMTVLIIKPEPKPKPEKYEKLSSLVESMIVKNDFRVLFCEEIMMSVEFCKNFYSYHVLSPYFVEMLEYLTSGPSVALFIKGENAVKIVREFVIETRKTFGKSGADANNLLHGSDSANSAKKERNIVKKFLSAIN
ncbi:MAG: nucleoside-diphosphate kinase [Patescibacteria group bacterium]